MNKYDNLLKKISRELSIVKVPTEDEIMWKSRIIYSVVGRWGMSSLCDIAEDDMKISIIYIKKKMKKILNAYMSMYPEVERYITVEKDEMVEDIYSRYINVGYLYHLPNYVLPANDKSVNIEDISFIRGVKLDSDIKISGLGIYKNNSLESDTLDCLFEMFNIPYIELKQYFELLIKERKWQSNNIADSVEYLSVKGPFNKGYWQLHPDQDGKISLMRCGEPGRYIYYLYKYEKEECFISQLSNWMVEGKKYRRISNSILAYYKTLPYINIVYDGDYVFININYLLPIEEQNFLELYSWPQNFYKANNNFKRVMKKDVFIIFRKMMDKIGIKVEE